VSDRSARGERDDASGPVIRSFVEERLNWTVAAQHIVPDERDAIRETLVDWCDDLRLNLIFTTGGTGFAPRDVTPEATRDVIEREAPGLAEAMRADSLQKTPHAMLSRAVCGLRGLTLMSIFPAVRCVRKPGNDCARSPHAIDLPAKCRTRGDTGCVMRDVSDE
jgi:molybdenum cofactor synthesis domain-containing protein